MKQGVRVRIEGDDATAAAFRSALGRASGTATTIEKVFKGAFAGIGGEVGRFGQQLGGIKNLLGVGGIAGAAGLVTMGFTKVVEQVRKAREEHERINDLAERLNLPTSQVKLYGEEWANVAVQMEDVRRGFADLGQVQIKAFDALNLDPSQIGSFGKALSRIAAATGDKQDKVDVVRILTGRSHEEASKLLEDEIDRLNETVRMRSKQNIRKTRAELEGIQFGVEDIGFLRRSGAILSPNELKDMEALTAAMQKFEDARVKLLTKTGAAEDGLTEIIGAGFKIRTDAMEAYYDGLDRETMTSTEKQLAGLDEVESALKELRDAGRISAEVFEARWKEAFDEVLQPIKVTAQYIRETVPESLQDLPDHALRAADRAQWAFEEAFFDPVNAGIKGLGRQLVDTLRASLAEGLADHIFGSRASGGLGLGDSIGRGIGKLSDLLGFANGGSFEVGGSGGTDSQLVAFKATPGEMVDIRTPGQMRGGVTLHVHNHIDARGATQDLVKTLPAVLERNNSKLKAEVINLIRGGAFA